MDFKKEIDNRIKWLRDILNATGAKGFVYGNSGGKDSSLVGILLSKVTKNVTGIVMPCESTCNYSTDQEHAYLVADKYGIHTIRIDLTKAKQSMREVLLPHIKDYEPMAYNNINPRLRMISLYSYAQSYNYLVVGTDNLSETTMGYFTKWGDGAYDINPIADITASEVFQMLKFLECPNVIIDKAPSAGLYEGQTDEVEMGITYSEIDMYIRTGKGQVKFIEDRKKKTEHKRKMPVLYGIDC